MKLSIKSSLAFILAVCILSQVACGGGFAQQFRLVLLAAPPLIESLHLSPALKSGLVTDFTDMGGRVADLADCLKASPDRPAKLACVSTLETQVETIINRGNFGNANNEKLNRILGLIRGIIASAKIYYGGTSSIRAKGAATVTEDSIKEQIKQLKAEMKVK